MFVGLKVRFPHAKEFLRKLSEIRTGASPVAGRRRLKNVGLKVLQIISLPRAPTCLGPALVDVNQYEGDQNCFHNSVSLSNFYLKVNGVGNR